MDCIYKVRKHNAKWAVVNSQRELVRREFDNKYDAVLFAHQCNVEYPYEVYVGDNIQQHFKTYAEAVNYAVSGSSIHCYEIYQVVLTQTKRTLKKVYTVRKQ